ncbi:MAG: alanine--tRNA ligase [Thermoplasmata archaeon]|nr:MAG: alanine--tRNA ligase [Thermoplasmata archaeon]
MHPELQKLLNLQFFKEEGFIRKKCEKCGAYFWTKNEKQKLCGDAPCVDYTFIGNPVGKKMDLHEMREAFLSFFERYGHTRLRRYPVVARWRDDIYLTIASIADFQPHVTSGIVAPPANPLVISQPSIRLNDLEEVGKSGRHLTLFEMMGHHAFNNEQRIYWTEETAKYCHHFLEEMGIEKVTYKEAEWAGGGNAGACLEVLSHGLEVATLVFMNLERSDDGNYVVKGDKYREMPLKIVDTGYGLERLVWLVNGSSTIYDAIFPYAIEEIKNGAKKEEMESIYAIADHARCLAFMLGDGIVPSNSGAGYLARLIIRRALRFMKKIGYDRSLYDVVEAHLKYLAKDFPELLNEKERIEEIIDIETGKFYSIIEKGKGMVRKYAQQGELNVEKLIELYDSHGIHPEIVKEVANVEIPENFESMVAERHLKAEEKQREEKEYEYETEQMYYEKDYDIKFDANVIFKENDMVILDKTLFYPEGGGEKSDTGFLFQNGRKAKVKKVEKAGKAIVHYIEGKIEKGKVQGEIDWKRRYAMMLHHTATHIINASARMTLGNHIWQAGSELDENEARLDVTHYKRISEKEVQQIEKLANEIVRKALPVKKKFMDRNEAEKKFGFRLYQGGAPKSGIIRVVEIPEVEAEACGGMHVNNTAEIGFIKIVGVERVQDGVERLRFCAGEKAIEYVQKQEKIVKETAKALNTQPDKIVEAIRKREKEWKSLRKEIEKLQKKLGGERAEEYEGVKLIVQDDLMPSAIKELTKENAVVISASVRGKNAVLTIACSEDLAIDCSEIAKEIGTKFGKGGGGRETIGQAGIELNKIEEAKNDAKEMIRKELEKS